MATTDPETLKKKKGSLKKMFGRVAALVSLAATLVFYGLGFQIGKAYFDQWQDNKAAATQTWDRGVASPIDHTKDLPWAPAGGALALSFGAGAAAIAAARSRRKYLYSTSSLYNGGGGYYGGGYGNNYYSNDGFWWGYFLGGGGRSSGGSSSSSNDNGGAAAALVIGAGVVLAASAAYVSGKAVKENFFTPDPEDWKAKSLDEPFRKAANTDTPVSTATPAPVTPAPEPTEQAGPVVRKKKLFEL